jgi:hypothetical protein
MRRGVLLSMLVLGIVAVLGAGSAQAKLDPSFGEGGVLHLRPPVPSGWNSQMVKPAASGSEGQVFVIDHQFPQCTLHGCPEGSGDFAFSYLASGALNTAYPATGYKIPPSGASNLPLLGVSPSGLALVAHEETTHGPGLPGSLHIQRLLPSGNPDPGFGLGGTAAFTCNCGFGNTRLLAGPGNSTLVMVTEEINSKSGPAGAATVYKLNGAGLAAANYGKGGAAHVLVAGQGALEYEALAANGSTYFGGLGKSTKTYQGTLTRVNAAGQVDTKFTQAATASLKRLGKNKGEELKVTSAVVAADGTVDLFGTSGTSKGFELKLRANGKLETKFADEGVRRLGRAIVAAVGGSEGATMALAQGQSTRVVRILADGRPDPAFGKSGDELPGQVGEVSLSPGGKGAVEAIDLGITECRGICQADPKVYRFLEH